MKNQKALVVFSGGQDSTTCLAWAKSKFKEVHTITFDYGQRHRIELEQAAKIAKQTATPHKIIHTNLFQELTESALLNSQEELTTGDKKNLPSSFVPGRNLIFLSLAAIYARQNNIDHLITGVCQTDYSGYPDCRLPFIQSLEQSINLAMASQITIHTPLMDLTKAQTVELMQELGQLDLLKHSHTCYQGLRPACGKCPACQLRLKGFQEANINDPLEYEQQ